MRLTPRRAHNDVSALISCVWTRFGAIRAIWRRLGAIRGNRYFHIFGQSGSTLGFGFGGRDPGVTGERDRMPRFVVTVLWIVRLQVSLGAET